MNTRKPNAQPHDPPAPPNEPATPDATDVADVEPRLSTVDVERRGRLLVDHYTMLHRYARRVLGGAANASDVLHDALVVILCHPTGPADERWFGSWCRGVLRHVAVRSFRLHRRADLLVWLGDEMANLPDDDSDWEAHAAERDLVSRKLGQLDQSARELLHRKYWLGENAGEIAADSTESAAAVRMRIKRLIDSFTKADSGSTDRDAN